MTLSPVGFVSMSTKSELSPPCQGINGDLNDRRHDIDTGTEGGILEAIAGRDPSPPSGGTSRHGSGVTSSDSQFPESKPFRSDIVLSFQQKQNRLKHSTHELHCKPINQITHSKRH
ncbi:hypothetical protein AVEN_224022-1 [Araneus ventricosus]|uniref:Uncharacterized protein n=1 Tax=Araneus ventricosus TaxID=182803 RepID=A0A4Y2TNI9_ARAVE|nr:hypothetical protein AVEN_266993-1 [Araneus ventricosus]GBO02186.1 hypothetical protein AVEN_224022-1 [Araneus ventricosus]